MGPLRFEPIFRRYLWGGKRLGQTLDKAVSPEDDVAESWEIVDRADDNSRVTGGEFDRMTLEQLISGHGRELLGESVYSRVNDSSLPAPLQGRFPLLMKFLDASKTLSVQVHPNDRQAARLSPPDLGKTEAWYVIDADPGSVIYAGLNPGVGPDQLREAVKNGTTEELLGRIYPKPGDCIFVPAGTVHAIGAGLLMAEIQQCSDTTYRLFDWNRVDSDGKARPLHIDEAIGVTDFDRGPVTIQQPVKTEYSGCETLVDCDKFKLNRWSNWTGPQRLDLGGTFRLLSVVSGELAISFGNGECELAKGQTALVPASLGVVDLILDQECVLLEISAL